MNFAFRQFMRRPEAGSVLGLLGVVAFFVVFGGVDLGILLGAASWVNFAANLGIVAIPVGILMIAGQLDISIGAMIPAGSMTAAILSGYFELPIVVGMLGALGVGVLVGLVNGILTVRTSVPSLIITLGTLVTMQGIVLSASVLLTGNASVSLTAPDWAKFLFGQLIGGSHQVIIVWWFVLTAILVFIVHKTRYGNWIFAMGGDKDSARNAGIPTGRLTIILFILSATSASFVGMCQAILFNSAQVSGGMNFIFNAIVSVVVGGVLLTGGFGSVPGHLLRHADLRGRQPGHLLHGYRPELVEPDHRRDAPDRGRDERELPENGAVLCDAKEEAGFVLTDTTVVALTAPAWARAVFGRCFFGSYPGHHGLAAGPDGHLLPSSLALEELALHHGGRQGKRPECRYSYQQVHDCPLFPALMRAAFVGECETVLFNSAKVSRGMSFLFNAIVSVLLLIAVLMNNTFRQMATSHSGPKKTK